MSRYTTDEVLRIMEVGYDQHKNEGGFDADIPFDRFDRLLGDDLSGVDLSRDTIENEAEK